MKIALHLFWLSWPGGPAALGPTLSGMARAADQGGFATVTMMDHYFQMEGVGGPFEPMLEGYTGLGFLAGQTSQIELGLLVGGVTYRHPGLLAKIITTLDVLSGGRSFLGLGAAWYEREHLGLGVPYPPLKERYERLEETLQICQQMWSDNDGPYNGTHYQLAETINLPQPIRKPPILIGGGGERKTLRLVAQYADACNLFGGDVDAVKRKLDVLDEHCAAIGRNPAEIERTIIGNAISLDDVDGYIASLEPYAALGITKVGTSPPPDCADPVRWVQDVSEKVVPRLERL
jgi:F420-dependent oxidoreductase-like protein